jgi:hypothetical protein
MLGVALNAIDVESAGFKMPESFLAEAVVTDTAGNDARVSEQSSDVGKICGSAAELRPDGKRGDELPGQRGCPHH